MIGAWIPIEPPVAVGGVTVGAVEGRVVAVVDDGEVVVGDVVGLDVDGAVGAVVGGALVDGVCAPTIVAVPPRVAIASATARTTKRPSRVEARGCAAPPGEEAKPTGYLGVRGGGR